MYKHKKKLTPCENATLLSALTAFFVICCFFLLVWVLTTQIKDHYSQYEPKLLELSTKLKKLFPDLCNSVSFHIGDSSYTINKSKIYLALCDKNGDYYSDNTLMHVLLHELAHVKSHDIGHTPLFHENFQKILEIAEKHGLYDPSIPVPDDYATNASGVCSPKKK